MKARPILMNGDMVRAVMREIEQPGRGKTQTRRFVNPEPNPRISEKFPHPMVRDGRLFFCASRQDEYPMWEHPMFCPYGQPGDLLYVRETFGHGWSYGGGDPVVFYRATGDGWIGSDAFPPADVMNGRFGVSSGQPACSVSKNTKWTPSIHMPRWASRITLQITDVRVERLQDISEEDAVAEGIDYPTFAGRQPDDLPDVAPSDVFAKLWDSIYGTWAENPWVWVIEFKPILANVDDVLREQNA